MAEGGGQDLGGLRGASSRLREGEGGELAVRLSPLSVAKSHDQVQQFIIEYNLRFKARLLFGSFMLQGIKEVV